MNTTEQMARRIVVINRNISTINNTNAVAGIHNGEWFITQDTNTLYWKDATTGEVRQIARVEDGSGPIIRNTVSDLGNTLELARIKNGEMFLLSSTGDIYYKKNDKITQVTGNTSVSNSVPTKSDFTAINKLPNGTFFTTLDTGNVYFKNTKDGKIDQVTETSTPNSPVLASSVANLSDALAISKLKNGEMFIIADSGDVYYKNNNEIIQITGKTDITNTVSTITNIVEIGKIKNNNFFITQDTGRAYFKSEKNGTVTQITNNSFYNNTTTQHPNTYVNADGNMERSTTIFGSVVTKNVGTAAGNVPLNSDLGTAAIRNVGTAAGNVPLVQDIRKITYGNLAEEMDSPAGKNANDLEVGSWWQIHPNMINGAPFTGYEISTEQTRNGKIQKAYGFLEDRFAFRILKKFGGWGAWKEVASLSDLGTAASKNVGTAAGNVMQVGAFGVGGVNNISPNQSFKGSVFGGGLSMAAEHEEKSIPADVGGFNCYYNLIHIEDSTGQGGSRLQIVGTSNPGSGLYFRNYRGTADSIPSSRTSWSKIYHTENTVVDVNGYVKGSKTSETSYTNVINALPNLVTAADGTIGRTATPLGDVATKSIGTTIGKVPTVENLFESTFKNDSDIPYNQDTTGTFDCNSLSVGKRIFVSTEKSTGVPRTNVFNLPVISGTLYYFIECKRGAASSDPGWEIQTAIAFPSGKVATRYAASNNWKPWSVGLVKGDFGIGESSYAFKGELLTAANINTKPNQYCNVDRTLGALPQVGYNYAGLSISSGEGGSILTVPYPHYSAVNAMGFHFLTYDYQKNIVQTDRILTDKNTTRDANGFIKGASPIVQVFSDKIELNGDAERQGVSFVKNGIGSYTLTTNSGLSEDGWYLELPKDLNGNPKIAVTLNQVDDVIELKTYKRVFDINTALFKPDLNTPLDIPEGRWIDIRLNEIIEQLPPEKHKV